MTRCTPTAARFSSHAGRNGGVVPYSLDRHQSNGFQRPLHYRSRIGAVSEEVEEFAGHRGRLCSVPDVPESGACEDSNVSAKGTDTSLCPRKKPRQALDGGELGL
jgi:hypothetical protein